MNKEEAIKIVEKITKQFHEYESIEIEIKDKKTVSYLAKIKQGLFFIPLGKERIVEVSFESNSVLVTAPLSTYTSRL